MDDLNDRTNDLPLIDSISLGQHIKRLRKQRNMTQSELGERFGANKSTIALYEKGRNGFSVTTLKKFAEALDADLKIEIILKQKQP